MNDRAIDLYLDLLEGCLTRALFPESWEPVMYDKGSWQRTIMAPIQTILRLKGYHLCGRYQWNPEARDTGMDWPPEAETMIGRQRLAHLRECTAIVLREGIPGDFCETGVWRGGASIFMRGVLQAYGDTTRKVWVCDSFEGLPKGTHEMDRKFTFYKKEQLAVSLDTVKSNFARYGLLDDQVQFVKGWFKDTLHAAPIRRLSVLRLDGDLYESTIQALNALYVKLSPGGFVIVDDYAIDACQQAVHDFRKESASNEPIHPIDQWSAFWRKER
jgi:O-methyltransferase